MNPVELVGWTHLKHGGLLLDPPRLREIAGHDPGPLPAYSELRLRRLAASLLDGDENPADFVSFVLMQVCGFLEMTGSWVRGPQVPPDWGRADVTGEVVKPRQLWAGVNGGALPVFMDKEPRLGIGHGRRVQSQVVQWLRSGGERLAVLTNGRQWRLVFAGLDFDAWCEWDEDLWLEEGGLSPQVHALRTLSAAGRSCSTWGLQSLPSSSRLTGLSDRRAQTRPAPALRTGLQGPSGGRGSISCLH